MSSPFIMAIFSAEGSYSHFVSTRTISIGRPFLLFPRHTFSSFQGRSFFQPYFCFFSRSRRIVSVILAYFPAPFIYNIIIISWEGKGINGVLEEHGCIKCLVYGERVCIKYLVLRKEKIVSWFVCAHMVTRIKLW